MNWFKNRVTLTPDHVAVIDADKNEKWTYHDLKKRSKILAVYLRQKGVKKGDRIALLSHNHLSYFDFFLAAMKIGAIFIPLNWRLNKEELTYVLQDCQPKFVGVVDSLQTVWEHVNSEINAMLIRDNRYLEQLANSDTEILLHNQHEESDPLTIIYTGGTTGKPKGVVLSYRSILWNAMNTVISWNFSTKDITLTTLPMFHTGGLNAFTIPILLAGGKVVIRKKFDPEEAVNDLLTYECTTALFVPTMYQMMIQTKVFQQATFPKMRVFVSGGAPCPKEIYDAFQKKGLSFREGYGLTEAGPNNFCVNPLLNKDQLESPCC